MAPLLISEIALAVLFCLLAKSVLEKALSISRAKRALGDCPGGSIIWFHPFRSAAVVLAPYFPFPNQIGHFYGKFSLYAQHGSTCLSSLMFRGDVPTFWLSDAEAIKVVSSDRNTFRRDLEGYEVVSVYGPNMVGTEGPDWKRHRAVAKPAFNEANNAFVWSQSTRVVNDWFTHINAKQDEAIRINLLKDLTQAALLILSSAAFGRHASWAEETPLDLDTTRASRLAFGPAVNSAVDNLVLKVLTPYWVDKLSEHVRLPYVGSVLRDTRESFEALRYHMLDLISLAREWVTGGKVSSMDAALLRNLVEANLAQEDNSYQRRLTDNELLSNTFMFLLAGHETSAHSLCFAVALLALYPEVQQRVYEEVLGLWPEGAPNTETTDPAVYRDSLTRLEYTTAVFQEALRLFPPVPRLAKPVHIDTTLTARRFEQSASGKLSGVKEFTVPVIAGSLIIIDIIALHLNPIHWGEDVAEFKPERFIDTESYRWPRDAFLAFSSGPRACMGERFAITESVCILANIIRKYEILIPQELKGKSHEEQKKALLQWIPRMTLVPTDCCVSFRLR